MTRPEYPENVESVLCKICLDVVQAALALGASVSFTASACALLTAIEPPTSFTEWVVERTCIAGESVVCLGWGWLEVYKFQILVHMGASRNRRAHKMAGVPLVSLRANPKAVQPKNPPIPSPKTQEWSWRIFLPVWVRYKPRFAV